MEVMEEEQRKLHLDSVKQFFSPVRTEHEFIV